MIKVYSVWCVDLYQTKETADQISSFSPSGAAEEWARRSNGFEFCFEDGDVAVLHVQAEDEGTPVRIKVSGEVRYYTKICDENEGKEIGE